MTMLSDINMYCGYTSFGTSGEMVRLSRATCSSRLRTY
jgi:hypothetical protein